MSLNFDYLLTIIVIYIIAVTGFSFKELSTLGHKDIKTNAGSHINGRESAI